MKSNSRRWLRKLMIGSGLAASLALGNTTFAQVEEALVLPSDKADAAATFTIATVQDGSKNLVGQSLGVRLRPLDETLKKQLRITDGFIVEVAVGKNAEVLHPHDIILTVNGKAITQASEVAEVTQGKEGAEFELGILREGKSQTVKVQKQTLKPEEMGLLIANAPFTFHSPSGMPPDVTLSFDRLHHLLKANPTIVQSTPALPTPTSKYVLGIELSPDTLSEDLKGTFNIEAGVVVRKPREGSPAEKAGIKAWDVITVANGKPITGVESLRDVLAASEGKEIEVTVVRKSGTETFKLVPEKIASVSNNTLDAEAQIFAFGEVLASPGTVPPAVALTQQLANNTSITLSKGGDGKPTISVQTTDSEGKKTVKTVDATPAGIAELPPEVRGVAHNMLRGINRVAARMPLSATPVPVPSAPYSIPNMTWTAPRQVVVMSPDGKMTTTAIPGAAGGTDQAIAELNKRAEQTQKQLDAIEKMVRELHDLMQKNASDKQ